MKVFINSIEETLFAGEAEKCIVSTPLGEITVLDGHIPLITIVNGVAKVFFNESKDNILAEKKIEFPIQFGFLEVRPPLNDGQKIKTEVQVLIADKEASIPITPVEISHKAI